MKFKVLLQAILVLFVIVIGSNRCLAQLDGNGNYNKDVLNLKHPYVGGTFLMNFHSKLNYNSDKAFILFQDKSSQNVGTSPENLRFTIGVHNDFRQNETHSDELWFQGGGRLVNNVGSWDAELNSLVGTPSSGGTGGYEWRVNNTAVMFLGHDGNLVLTQPENNYRAFDVKNFVGITAARFETTNDGTER